jgi:hypothetical protein
MYRSVGSIISKAHEYSKQKGGHSLDMRDSESLCSGCHYRNNCLLVVNVD